MYESVASLGGVR